MRIYLVRHGETVLNQKGCYYGRTEAALSESGREQARKLGAFFQDIPLRRIVSSPRLRAMETADIIMAQHMKKTEDIKKTENEKKIKETAPKLQIEKDERLSEQDFGIFEGYTYQELTKKYPEEWRQWNRDFSGYRIPEGESFLDVRKRTEDFFQEWKQFSGTADREDAILLVAHKGTLGHLLAVSLGLPPEGYWNFVFEQGCYSRVDLEDGYAIIRCLNQHIDDVLSGEI